MFRPKRRQGRGSKTTRWQRDDAVAARGRGGRETTRWRRDDEVAVRRRGGFETTPKDEDGMSTPIGCGGCAPAGECWNVGNCAHPTARYL